MEIYDVIDGNFSGNGSWFFIVEVLRDLLFEVRGS